MRETNTGRDVSPLRVMFPVCACVGHNEHATITCVACLLSSISYKRLSRMHGGRVKRYSPAATNGPNRCTMGQERPSARRGLASTGSERIRHGLGYPIGRFRECRDVRCFIKAKLCKPHQWRRASESNPLQERQLYPTGFTKR